MKKWDWLLIPVGVLALYLAFILAPPELHMKDRQRIMYFHVASAWNAYLAFIVVFFASVMYLRTSRRRWDHLALSSAELGVFFTSTTLLSGMVWGRSVWNKWWVWDPRLTTTLILWFIYVGYLLLRYTSEGDERRARLAAGLGIIGFIDVPIVHMSAIWWSVYHPPGNPMDVLMDGRMGMALGVSVLTFTLLYFYLLGWRVRLEGLKERVAVLRERLR